MSDNTPTDDEKRYMLATGLLPLRLQQPLSDMEQMRKDVIRIHSDAIHQMGGDPVQRSYVDALVRERDAAIASRDMALALAEQRAGALRTVRLWLHNDASDVYGADIMLRTVNAALIAAAPPPAIPDEAARLRSAIDEARRLIATGDDMGALDTLQSALNPAITGAEGDGVTVVIAGVPRQIATVTITREQAAELGLLGALAGIPDPQGEGVEKSDGD